uniref:Uncharacterized protein n=1 Tax=Meloidogyne enterolobii TaxID=390850 RepID=A0A6V7WYN8_MELEN|nr:unnamed protein product [Meloidogyne enterolobii]
MVYTFVEMTVLKIKTQIQNVFIQHVFYCKTVEGSNDANWYWQNPEGEWILVNLMDCYPIKGLNKGKLKENKRN